MNARDLDRSGWLRYGLYKVQAEAVRPDEESERPIVPTKAAKAAGGKGASLGNALEARKERRLWEH